MNEYIVYFCKKKYKKKKKKLNPGLPSGSVYPVHC